LKAYTTHFTQRLDNAENGLFKLFLQQLQETPKDASARSARQCIAEAVPLAVSSAFTGSTIIRCFRVTGIWPVDISQIAGRLHHAKEESGSAAPPALEENVSSTSARKDHGFSFSHSLFSFFFFFLFNFRACFFLVYIFLLKIYFSFFFYCFVVVVQQGRREDWPLVKR
jgi:hypothetical protein